jgi:hypothetical protein
MAVELAVMQAAHGNGEFVAHLPTHGARLRKTQMMRVSRCSSTHKTRLHGNESSVILVAQADGFDRHSTISTKGLVLTSCGSVRISAMVSNDFTRW